MFNCGRNRKISLPWFRQPSLSDHSDHVTKQQSLETAQNGAILGRRWLLEDYTARKSCELTVSKGVRVDLVQCDSSPRGMCLVRVSDSELSGFLPSHLLTDDQGQLQDSDEPMEQCQRPKSKINQWRSVARKALTSTHPEKHIPEKDFSTTQNQSSCSSQPLKDKPHARLRWFPMSLRRHKSTNRTKLSPTVTDLPSLSDRSSDSALRDTSPGPSSPDRCDSHMGSNNTTLDTAHVDQNRMMSDDQPSANSSDVTRLQSTDETESRVGPDPNSAADHSQLHHESRQSSTNSKTADEVSGSCDPSEEPHVTDSSSTPPSPPLSAAATNGLYEASDSPERREASVDGEGSSGGSKEVVQEGEEDDTNEAGASEPAKNESQEEKARRKRSYVVQEMVDTEREYIRSLSQAVEGYMKLMKDPECSVSMPEGLATGKDKMVFGNIETIYDWHRDVFLKALERCVERPGDLGILFRRYERKFHMYVIYCQNKPRSEYIVSEYMDTYFEELRKVLGYKHQITDVLIQPIQRIMRYQLLLKEISKLTEQIGDVEDVNLIQKALHVMTVVPKDANDMMNVGRLQGYDGKITAQGKLLKYGSLHCHEGAAANHARAKEHVVFLFEQSVIISEALPRRSPFVNPGYLYKSHIQINKLVLDEKVCDADPCQFILRCNDPSKSNIWSCRASSNQECKEWVSQFRGVLSSQMDFLRALQSPIAFQKEHAKDF